MRSMELNVDENDEVRIKALYDHAEGIKPEEILPEPEPVPPLSEEELLAVRWVIFGKCPRCGATIKDWQPPAFNIELYDELRDKRIDPLSGHKEYCDQKWVKWLWNGG